ncbi:hypothetical protein O206_23430 [Ochrobactrum sp. EGD-AQ16]|nr:hypothetical protein O206_23430 [Ochrobactrum sp. EGD-AQ16]MPR64729.1 hypothetical protein [Brucella intermedia]
MIGRRGAAKAAGIAKLANASSDNAAHIAKPTTATAGATEPLAAPMVFSGKPVTRTRRFNVLKAVTAVISGSA